MTTIAQTLDTALLSVPTTPGDAATVHLARSYAELIDAEGDLVKVGPLLLAVLAQLGMTPKARSAVTGGGAPGGPSDLDKFRAKRAARLNGT